MLINKKTGDVISFCCDDMRYQFKDLSGLTKEEILEKIDLNELKEQQTFFYYDSIAKKVFLRFVEWSKDSNEKFFLDLASYTVGYCPFPDCGEKIEIVDPDSVNFIIKPKDVPKGEARLRIKKFFKENNKSVYLSELAEKLHIDYELVLEIIQELDEDGVISIDDKNEHCEVKLEG